MAANSLPMLRPECPAGHGRMELRPLDRQTYEQRWCGTWYDCTAPGCGCSVLYESAELRAQLAEMGDPRYATHPTDRSESDEQA